MIVSVIARRLRKDSFQNLRLIIPCDFDLANQMYGIIFSGKKNLLLFS